MLKYYKVFYCVYKIKFGLEIELIDGLLGNKVN